MRDLKIVFTGTPGAGKTTAIAALSHTMPVTADLSHIAPFLAEAHGPIGLDVGQIDLGKGQPVQLLGTPGQLHFKFMWQLVATDALGLVILIDNSRPAPWDDFATYLNAYRDLWPTMNCAVGIGRTADHPLPNLDDYCDILAAHGLVFPVLAVDVRRRSDVLMLIDAVLAQAEMHIERDPASPLQAPTA